MPTKPSILVIDDEKDMLETFKAILKRSYTVSACENGKEAVKKILANNFSLVLLDIKMPKVDDIQILKQIKELNRSQEVIMVTAFKDIKSAVACMKLGAYDYVTKPFEVEELLSTIERSLEKKDLLQENKYLRTALEEASPFGEIIGQSKSIKEVFEMVEKIAPAPSTVLIQGESGTGKELVARAIHKKSSRKNKPFITVNCAAIPENLLESELFGHEKGAFTGAGEKHLGKFEQAHSGTIFLDEIGCMSLSMQAKLLRVLQEGEVERVGGTRSIVIDVRTISATNTNLKELVEQKKFREDLYYRLNVIPVSLPPLRERQEDIPLLLRHFLDKYNKKIGRRILGFIPEAEQILKNYSWPGNIRELQNMVERLVVLGQKEKISAQELPLELSRTTRPPARRERQSKR